ncbi:MAG TPA: VIT1/CCC1 transporter family protein [Burkholderiales bacterium]|nr:VIT1/CCC1 transporter family protein [Burkholderiales bacterium]
MRDKATDAWFEEMRSAYLYRVMSEAERGTVREALFRELAGEAEHQAAIWARSMKSAPPAYVPSLRARIAAALIRNRGPKAMRGILAAMKVRGLSIYTHPAPGHPTAVSVEEIGKRHRVGAGSNLRAAVFGINDGLVSNCSLILGVAGASGADGMILLSGAAGLLAGAFSMAAGEYVSVRSQREMFEYQIGLERQELEEYPEQEAQELAMIYAARGLPKDEALAVARKIIADPEHALDTLAREELGLNPDDLASPWGAAISSLFSFSVGALVPLLPFLLLKGNTALGVSIAATACALFAVGATLSLFTGRSAFYGGLRMLLIGGGAGALTYMVGKLLGVNLG